MKKYLFILGLILFEIQPSYLSFGSDFFEKDRVNNSLNGEDEEDLYSTALMEIISSTAGGTKGFLLGGASIPFIYLSYAQEPSEIIALEASKKIVTLAPASFLVGKVTQLGTKIGLGVSACCIGCGLTTCVCNPSVGAHCILFGCCASGYSFMQLLTLLNSKSWKRHLEEEKRVYKP